MRGKTLAALLCSLLIAPAVRAGSISIVYSSSTDCRFDPGPCERYPVFSASNLMLEGWRGPMSLDYVAPETPEWEIVHGDLFESSASGEFFPGGSLSLRGTPFGEPLTILTGSFGGGDGSYHYSLCCQEQEVDLSVTVNWVNPDLFARFGPQAIYSGRLTALGLSYAIDQSVHGETQLLIRIDNAIPEPGTLSLVLLSMLIAAISRWLSKLNCRSV